MTKWGTNLIVIALILMVLPFVFIAFGADTISENPLFPIFTLIFGGLGVVLHLFSMVKSNTVNGSAVILMISVLSIIYGFALKSLGIENAKYLLLLGALLIAVWIIIPNSRNSE